MNALVLDDYMKLVFRDMPTPEVGADDVLVEVKACGICGSDVHGLDGSTGRRRPPLIMGHEAAGIIAAVGSGVSGWSPGARVTFDSTIFCGRCCQCRSGHINLCDNRRVLGVSCEDYRCHGAFADYVAVPARILYAVPDSVSFAEAAMVEALSIAVHAVDRRPLRVGDTAVVVGVGMIGQLVVQVLRTSACGRIIAVDIDAAKLEAAGRVGATAVIDAGAADVPAAVAALTDGRGADVVFEVVGLPATVETTVGCVRKGGDVTLVGNVTPQVLLPLQRIVTAELTLHGSCASCGEYSACLDLIASGRVDVSALISARAPLAEGAAWFRRLYDGEDGLMKVILEP